MFLYQISNIRLTIQCSGISNVKPAASLCIDSVSEGSRRNSRLKHFFTWLQFQHHWQNCCQDWCQWGWLDGDCGRREEGGWTDWLSSSSSSPVAVNTRPPLPPSLPHRPSRLLQILKIIPNSPLSLSTIYKEPDYNNVVMEISFQSNEIMRDI